MTVTTKLGTRKIRKTNYTHQVSLPKVLLENLGANMGDAIDFLYVDGEVRLALRKRE